MKDYYQYLAKSPKRSTITVELTKRKCICRKVKSAWAVEVFVMIDHKKKCQIKYERQHQESKETHLEDWMSNDNVVDAVFVVHCCVHRNLKPVEDEGAQTKNCKRWSTHR